MHANIEADEILYRAACSVEKQSYKLSIIKSHHNSIIGGRCIDFGHKYTRTRILEVMKRRGKKEGEDYILQGYKSLIPDETTSIAHAIHLIKIWVDKIKSHCDSYQLWLSPADKSNFRYNISKTPRIVNNREIKGYKAGRPDRPIHYEVCRDYLINVLGAKEIYGMEADDALGIYKGLMVHIDKDINMIPGEHLHWVDNIRYTVPEGIGRIEYVDNQIKVYGTIFFYIQMLTGDSTDNIPGVNNPFSKKICNFGIKTAYNYLKDCKKEEELFDKVKQVYYTVYKLDWKSKLSEIADLVWILRDKDVKGSEYLKGVK